VTQSADPASGEGL